MSNRAYSASESDASDGHENAYCIFLHIVEGVGLNPHEGAGDFYDRHKDKIILNASLNGVKFEVEGHSTETATIFNSNCIWECELSDIKKMKTDNRPVKLECFTKSVRTETSPRRIIGSLLLPIRGVQALTALRDTQFKLHWHKLGALNSEWRPHRPEIYLLLIIVKKQLIESGQLEALLNKKKLQVNDMLPPYLSETAMMLQSQSNVYVQLLEQLGVIQVGNNPDIDCDIFHVTLTFKQLRNVEKLLELERQHNRQTELIVFHYDFLGSVSQLEIFVNSTDCYAVNEKISLSFKSSLKSLRLYFQRIFYIPINLYLNGIAIANYRLDVSKLLPEDMYFNTHVLYTKNGAFCFDRLHKILSPRASKPAVDFIFSMQLVNSFSKRNNYELIALNETFVPYKIDDKAAGDMQDCYRNMDMPQTVQLHKLLTYENCMLHPNLNPMTSVYDKNYFKSHTESWFINNAHTLEDKMNLYLQSTEEYEKDVTGDKEDITHHVQTTQIIPVILNHQCVGTSDAVEGKLNPLSSHKSVATENKENDANILNTTSVGVNTDNKMDVGSSTEETVSETKINIEKEVQTKTLVEQNIRKDANDTFEVTAPLKTRNQETITIEEKKSTVDTEELTYKIVQELEEWKAQQMEYFLCELERKEATYMTELENQWKQKNSILQAQLEAKTAQCAELNAKLTKLQDDFNRQTQENRQNVNIADAVKKEIERNYAQKFNTLDVEMERLKVEMQQKGIVFEIQNKQVQIENTKLQQDKITLKDRIEQLEKQLIVMEQTQISSEQLKQVLADVRVQNDRYAEMEKSKNHYKEQLHKVKRDMQKLKLAMMKHQQKSLKEKNSKNIEHCLEEILNDEQAALESDRSELNSIKQMLFISSDTSACEQEDD